MRRGLTDRPGIREQRPGVPEREQEGDRGEAFSPGEITS
jgi:hypothetical protein